MRTAERLTVHDLDQAVESVDQGADSLAQQRSVTAATRPGFLVAVADLLDMALQPSARSAGRPALEATRIRYVFGEQMYELRVRGAEAGTLPFRGASAPVLKTSFESRSLTTGARSHFVVTAGTSGDLAGVPLEINWQPRWWLRVRLNLAE